MNINDKNDEPLSPNPANTPNSFLHQPNCSIVLPTCSVYCTTMARWKLSSVQRTSSIFRGGAPMHYFVASLLVTSFLIAVASSQAQTTESWRDLDDFLKSGLSYDSSGNVVPRNVAGQGQWRVRLQDVVSETNVAVFELEG